MSNNLIERLNYWIDKGVLHQCDELKDDLKEATKQLLLLELLLDDANDIFDQYYCEGSYVCLCNEVHTWQEKLEKLKDE